MSTSPLGGNLRALDRGTKEKLKRGVHARCRRGHHPKASQSAILRGNYHSFEPHTLDGWRALVARAEVASHSTVQRLSVIASGIGLEPVKGAACAPSTLGCAWNLVTPSFCLGWTFGYPNHLPPLPRFLLALPLPSKYIESSGRTMAAAADLTDEGDRHTDHISLAL